MQASNGPVHDPNETVRVEDACVQPENGPVQPENQPLRDVLQSVPSQNGTEPCEFLQVPENNGERVKLGARQFDLLCLLVARPGQVIPKDTLITGVWGDVAVTIGSIDQALYVLRQTVVMPSGEPIIETKARNGVCFVVPVSRVERQDRDEAIDSVLATHRAWLEGRAALDTLVCDGFGRARVAFHDLVKRSPKLPQAHVGLANACAMPFERTRTDLEPDVASLVTALTHDDAGRSTIARARTKLSSENWTTSRAGTCTRRKWPQTRGTRSAPRAFTPAIGMVHETRSSNA